MAVCMIPNCRKNAPSDDPFCAEHRDKDPHEECKRELSTAREELARLRGALQEVAECPNLTGLGPRGIARAALSAKEKP